MLASGCGDLSRELVVGRLPLDIDGGIAPLPDLGVPKDAGLPEDTGGFGIDLDLSIVEVAALPAALAPGAALDPFIVDVQNLGRDASAPTRVDIRLIPTESLSGAPTLMAGSIPVPALEGRERKDVVGSLHVPSTARPGRYEVRLEVDPFGSLPEMNRSNNVVVAGGLDVTALHIEPTPVDLGVVGPGCEASTSIELSVGPTIVNGVFLDPAEVPVRIAAAPPVPFSVSPGRPQTLTLAFAPMLEGPTVTDLVLTYDGFAGPRRVRVVAQAQSTPERRDVFEQAAAKLDVLLVIQNSCPRTVCPIEEEQLQLAEDGLGALIRALAAENADWRILVTTSESRTRRVGQLRGAPLDATTVGLYAEAARQIRAGVGSSVPPGFVDATSAVLAADYIRAETGVVVVMLAMDDEGVFPPPAANGLAEIRTALGRTDAARRVHINAILPPSPRGCPERAPPAPGLEALVAASDGTVSSACDIDDFRALADFGDPELGLTHAFRLRHPPADPSTVEVEVGGRSLAPYDASVRRLRWIYDAPSRSVVFQPGYVPARGAEVAIRYLSDC